MPGLSRLARSVVPAAGLLLAAATAHSHEGARVFSVYELPTADLPDLHDGTLSDWEAALPMASIGGDAMRVVQGDGGVDDLAVRAYFAWHHDTQRLLFALELVDDDHVTDAESVILMVDGDHSGGTHSYFLESLPDGERRTLEGSQAQRYAMQPESLRHPIGFGNPAFLWAATSPWTDLGTWATGSRPATAAIEAELTLWDELSAEGPGSSRRTRLAPGGVIGLQLIVSDVDGDDTDGQGRYLPTLYTLGTFLPSFSTADGFVDAQLVPCGILDCSGAADTAVRQDSWGRIKASFR